MCNKIGFVYLIRLDTKLSHAQYYIGFALEDPLKRLKKHRSGHGAKILAAAMQKGINFHIVRVRENVDRHFERKLKNRKNAKKLCPIINPKLKNHLYKHYTA